MSALPRPRVLACLLVPLLAACDVAPPVEVEHSAIINGQPDTTRTAVVALVIKMYNEEFCTGTVIAPRAVLTAGHCIRESQIPTSQMAVFFGDKVGGAGTSINVTAANVHPNYYTAADGSPMFDVAVLTLAQDAPVAGMPWQRKTLDDPHGKTVTLVGYGVTNAAAQSGSGTRRTVDEVVTQMDDNFIYFGSGVSGTCQGDSGGPMFLNQNGTLTLVAVTSAGDQTCVNFNESTRVDIYADFISPLAPVPLTVAIQSPATGSTVGHGFTVQVQADSLAGVTKVDLSLDGAPRSSLYAPPWSFDLQGLADGQHEIDVTATAGDGKTGGATAIVNVVTAKFGEPCTANTGCEDDVCIDGASGNGYCSKICTAKSDCPDNATCDPVDPATSVCGRPASSGRGCAAGGAAGSGSALVLLLGLAVLVARRRR
jgi:MYXO-CTERM domain-containing protein